MYKSEIWHSEINNITFVEVNMHVHFNILKMRLMACCNEAWTLILMV